MLHSHWHDVEDIVEIPPQAERPTRRSITQRDLDDHAALTRLLKHNGIHPHAHVTFKKWKELWGNQSIRRPLTRLWEAGLARKYFTPEGSFKVGVTYELVSIEEKR